MKDLNENVLTRDVVANLYFYFVNIYKCDHIFLKDFCFYKQFINFSQTSFLYPNVVNTICLHIFVYQDDFSFSNILDLYIKLDTHIF